MTNEPYALLGLIERKPRYGYELKQAYERLFADTRPIRVGQLYATLQRLARDGTIMLDGEEPGDAGPDRKRFSITDAGRSELDAWLAAPEPPETFLQTTLFTKVVLVPFAIAALTAIAFGIVVGVTLVALTTHITAAVPWSTLFSWLGIAAIAAIAATIVTARRVNAAIRPEHLRSE